MPFLPSFGYRESLRGYPYIQGCQIDVVADALQFVPGINGIGLTYDFALDEELSSLMRE